MEQGDIYWVDFNPTIGSEINKIRPAIILNDSAFGKLPLKIVVPLSDVKKAHSWHVTILANSINNLKKDSFADCFQMKSLSNTRITKYIGRISEEELAKIKISILQIIGAL